MNPKEPAMRSDELVGRLRSELVSANKHGDPDLADLLRTTLDELTRLRAQVPKSCAVVPRRPTKAMLASAGIGADGLKLRIWRAMLSAAPKPQKAGEVEA